MGVCQYRKHADKIILCILTIYVTDVTNCKYAMVDLGILSAILVDGTAFFTKFVLSVVTDLFGQSSVLCDLMLLDRSLNVSWEILFAILRGTLY